MEAEQLYENKTIAILLVAASIVLLANGIYDTAQFSVQYGIGFGALTQSDVYNISVIPQLQGTALQVNSFSQAIWESFIVSGIGLVMFAMALLLLSHGPNRYESFLRKYVPLHLTLSFVYLLLLFIIHFTPVTDLYVSYVALALCIVFDVYLEYNTRRILSGRKFGRSISINPSTPYANLVALKDQLFDDLKGDIGIVDKHFNSVAMSNLYRLIPVDKAEIKTLRILTSEGMLDSRFGSNYSDLKEELRNAGIDVEVKIMKPEDAMAQHERFLFDDLGAYHIPPLNIINRKSEHIIRMNMKDAKRRFDYLYQNAIKFENYSEKQARSSPTP